VVCQRVRGRVARIHPSAQKYYPFPHSQPSGLGPQPEDLLGVVGALHVLEHRLAAVLGQGQELPHVLDPVAQHGRLVHEALGDDVFPGFDGVLLAVERQQGKSTRHLRIDARLLQHAVEVAQVPERVDDASGQVGIQALRFSVCGQRGVHQPGVPTGVDESGKQLGIVACLPGKLHQPDHRVLGATQLGLEVSVELVGHGKPGAQLQGLAEGLFCT
jgi:hypothetical protein